MRNSFLLTPPVRPATVSAMTRLWQTGAQPIEAHLDEKERLTSFTWHGTMHPIRRVEQQWEIDTDWWTAEGRVWRHYYAVTTITKLLVVIYREMETGEWFVGRMYD